MKRNNQYQILFGKEWERVIDAKEVKNGWLHYELEDGTNGLAKPGTWQPYVKGKKK